MLPPAQIAHALVDLGVRKTKLSTAKMLVLGIFAGMFIAFAGAASATASAAISNPSAARLAMAVVFPTGLAMVMLAGSELFTGNNLIILAVLEKKVRVLQMLKNWCLVYLGNLIGSLLIAVLFVYSHTPDLYSAGLAQNLVNTGAAKISLSFPDAFLRGIL